MKAKLLLLIGLFALSGCLAQSMSASAPSELQTQVPALADSPALMETPEMHREHKHKEHKREQEMMDGDLAPSMSTSAPTETKASSEAVPASAMMDSEVATNGRKLLWWNNWGNNWNSGQNCWWWWQRCQSQRCQCTEIVNNNNNNNGRRLLDYPWGWYDHDQNRCVCDVVVNNNNNNNGK